VLQQDIVRDQGIVNKMIGDIGVTRVVVDSISNLEGAAKESRQFRESVYALVNALKASGLTAVLTCELQEGEEIGAGPEEFVADGLILLTRSYVQRQRMRFLEVVKSRGTPHIPIPSLYFIGKGGIHILPPFQEPFYRFEEPVSTGIRQLDDLLGGGIPHGSFYLMEVDVNLHQDIFDADFAKEALEAGDRYVRIGGQSDPMSRWRALMTAAGMSDLLDKGIDTGQVMLLGGDKEGTSTGASLSKSINDVLTSLCSKENAGGVRFQVNISRLFSLMSPEEANSTFAKLTSQCRGTRSVILGVVTPGGMHPAQLAKLRAAADGILRVWSEGNYSFLEVVKTVNSARTPVYAIRQTPKPPFIEIME